MDELVKGWIHQCIRFFPCVGLVQVHPHLHSNTHPPPRAVWNRLLTLALMSATGRQGGIRLDQLHSLPFAPPQMGQRSLCTSGALITPVHPSRHKLTPSPPSMDLLPFWRIAKQPPSQQDLRVLTFPIHLHGAVSEEMVWNDRFLLRVTRWGAYEKMASESAQVLFVRSYQPQDAKQFLRSAKKSAGTAVFHQRLKRGLDRIRNLCGPAGLSVLPVISTEDQVLSLPFLSTWGVDGLRVELRPLSSPLSLYASSLENLFVEMDQSS